ncbi:glycosyltransferase [Pseudomonas fluorescens]|uniref:glycosyltransferase n=1 Tax=Pseudomonas fluorescens TaxID=294 RepID=UPI001781FE69|nr:glycosyltransferase [Pseudomonas fluorescens]
MINPPLVSIVIPAFNADFFSATLQSALSQTYENLEIVVCDDSRDNLIKQIVDACKGQGKVQVRYLRNPQRLGFQRNFLRCVEQAQGEYIKVLCDDDRLTAQCIELQARVLTEHADVSLVQAHRLQADADDFVLPMRSDNCPFALVDSVFKGTDLLAVMGRRRARLLGNLSSALMRLRDVRKLLPALTTSSMSFDVLLDQALFMCLIQRGNLAMLTRVLCVERLHPERLGKQPEVSRAQSAEWDRLQEMLAAKAVEKAPAGGWVRYVQLIHAGEPERDWKELYLLRMLSNWHTTAQGRVGSDCESYAELYKQWLAARRFSQVQRKVVCEQVVNWPSQPKIVPVIIDPDGDVAALKLTLDSLASQLYAPTAVLLLSDTDSAIEPYVVRMPLAENWSAQINSALPALEGVDWIYLLRAGDRLSESALLLLAERIVAAPGIRCAYSDEGAMLDGESCDPVFKPGFNLDLMRAYPYVGRTLAFERQHVLASGGFDPSLAELAPHDMLWRLVESCGLSAVEHIAEVQVESAFSYAQWLSLPSVIEQNEVLVSAHLNRLGVEHRVRHDELPLLNRIDYLYPQRPLVSLIVVAGDDVPTVQGCIESVLEKTAYSHYELLIVGRPDCSDEMRGWLDAMAQMGGGLLRVIDAPPGASVAAINNFAAEHARGDYLLMFAADNLVCQAAWLNELLNYAQRPEVGVVGARIVDPGGKIASAGVILGLGGAAGAAFAGERADSRGYMQRLQVAQNWSAVSGSCLMVRAEVFRSLGGFDEAAFAQSLADIDLCLRVGQAGYLVVGTPYSSIVQTVQSKPCYLGAEAGKPEYEALIQRWLPSVIQDPAYNPSLSLTGSVFSLGTSRRDSWNPLVLRTLPSILALPVNNTAVGHYRVNQPLRELEAAGRVLGRISFEVPSSVEIARVNPDVVVIQLRHSAESVDDIVRVKSFTSARRVYEIDDYVLAAPQKNDHARNTPLDTEQQLRRGIGLCDRVVVTTDALANALSSMHQDIRVVPNMLTAHMWQGLKSQRGTSRKPRVGWGGGSSHGGDLEIIAEVVRELANEVEWVFFGMCPENLKPYIHEYHQGVALADYPAKLASLNLDLALAPLEFHIFNDCKSNLRLLEYGACGYPVICTDTEAYRGYLPCTRVKTNSTQEWLQAIRMHLADPVASYRMGDELREAVLRDYVLRADSLQHWVWGWLAD